MKFVKIHRGNYDVYLNNKLIGMVLVYNLLNSNSKNWTYRYLSNKFVGQQWFISMYVYKSRKAAVQGLINEPERIISI